MTLERAIPAADAPEPRRLKRALSLFDLVVYGLVFIVPIGPWSAFGFVFNLSHGMVPAVYLVGLGAMTFTAISYMTMSKAFPMAGSVYAYANHGIGPRAGFMAGWSLLLDYLLLPAQINVACAVSIHAVFPAAPGVLIVTIMVSAVTVANLLGIEGLARISVALLVLQLLLIALLIGLGVLGVSHGLAGAHYSLRPFYNPGHFSPSVLFGALSLAVVTFLGFDGISTLAEEAKGGAKAVGTATLLALVVSAGLFVVQTYFASLFVLDRRAFAEGAEANTAFLGIATLIGGPWFRFCVSVLGVVFSGIAAALAAQAATARLAFSMARDGRLPAPLAALDARHSPRVSILVVAAISLLISVAMVEHLEALTAMTSFGALCGFLALHISVIVHFFIRGRSGRLVHHLLVPLVGGLIVVYVLFNAQAYAKTVGLVWTAAGLLILMGETLAARREA